MIMLEAYEDKLTEGERKKFNEKTRNEILIFIFFGLVLFIMGMIFGSTFHDELWHPVEPTTGIEAK